MTEKEKMLHGDPYNSRDPELLKMYHHARKLLKKLNECIGENQLEVRDEILTKLLEHKGKGVWIEAPFFCDYGNNISIGENTFVNVNCMFLDNNKISIGKNGLIGPYVQIYTALHPLKASERINQSDEGAPYITYAKSVKMVLEVLLLNLFQMMYWHLGIRVRYNEKFELNYFLE